MMTGFIAMEVSGEQFGHTAGFDPYRLHIR